MVSITSDPQNPDRLLVSATVQLWLDRVALAALSDEIEAAVRAQAAKDLADNAAVRELVASAATAMLLTKLKEGR